MPDFHNATDKTLKFEIDGERYCVGPGQQCEVPRKFVYVIKERGLPLTRGAIDGADEVEPQRVRVAEPKLPPGVESGPARDAEDDDDDDSDEDTTDPAGDAIDEPPAAHAQDDDAADPVADAARKLAAQGVQLPGNALSKAERRAQAKAEARAKAEANRRPAPPAAQGQGGGEK